MSEYLTLNMFEAEFLFQDFPTGLFTLTKAFAMETIERSCNSEKDLFLLIAWMSRLLYRCICVCLTQDKEDENNKPNCAQNI